MIVGIVSAVSALMVTLGSGIIVYGLWLMFKDFKGFGGSSTPDPTVQATAIAQALVDAGFKGGVTHNYNAPLVENTIVAIDASVKINIEQLAIMYFLGMPSPSTKPPKNPTPSQAWKEMLRKREELINNLQNWVNDSVSDSAKPHFDVDDRVKNMRMLTGFTTVYSSVTVNGAGKKMGGKTVLTDGQKLDIKKPYMILNDPFGVYHCELFRSNNKTLQTENYRSCPKLHMLNTHDMHNYYDVYRKNYLKIWGETKEANFISDYEQMIKVVQNLITLLQSHLSILQSFTDEEITKAIACINKIETELWNYRLFGALFTLDPKTNHVVDWAEFEKWWLCWTTNKYGIEWLWDHKNDPRHVGYILYKLKLDLSTLNNRKKLRAVCEDLLMCLRRYDDKRDAKGDYRLRDGIQMLHAFMSDKNGAFRFNKDEHKKMFFAHQELSRVYGALDIAKNKEFAYFSALQSFLRKLNALKDESMVPSMLEELKAIVALYRGQVDQLKKVLPELQPTKSLYKNEDFRLGIYYAINEAKKENKWGVKGLCTDEVQGLGVSMVPLSHGVKPIPVISETKKCAKQTQDWFDWWVSKRGVPHYAERITQVHAQKDRFLTSWEGLKTLSEFYLVEVRIEKATGQQIPADGFEALYTYLSKLVKMKDKRVTEDMVNLHDDLKKVYDGFYRGWGDHINQFLKFVEQKNGIAAKEHTKNSPEEQRLFNETVERFKSTIDFFGDEGKRLAQIAPLMKTLWGKHGCHVFESVLLLADADGVTKYDRVVENEIVEPGIILEDVVPHGFDIKKIQEKGKEPVKPPTGSSMVSKDCQTLIASMAEEAISASKEMRLFDKQIRALVTSPNLNNIREVFGAIGRKSRMLDQARYQSIITDGEIIPVIEYVLYALSGRDGDTTKEVNEILYTALVSRIAGLPKENTLTHLGKAGGIRKLVRMAQEYGKENLNIWLNDVAYDDNDSNRNTAYDGKIDEYLKQFPKLPGVLHDIPIAWNHAIKLISKDKLSQLAVCALINSNLFGQLGKLTPSKYKPVVGEDQLRAYFEQNKENEALDNVWKKHHLSRRQKKFAEEVAKNPDMEHKVVQFNEILQGATVKTIADEDRLGMIKDELDKIKSTGLQNFNKAQIEAAFKDMEVSYAQFGKDITFLEELFNKPSSKQLVRAEATRYSYYSRFKRNYSKLIKESHEMYQTLEELKRRLETGIGTVGKPVQRQSPDAITQFLDKAIGHIDKALGHIKQYGLKMDAEEQYCNKRMSEALEEAVALIRKDRVEKRSKK